MSSMLKELSSDVLLHTLLFYFAASTKQHSRLTWIWATLSSSSMQRRLHSGFPGGMTSVVYADLINQDPTRVVEKAILGMIPKNKLGSSIATKLKVYAGPTHPHAAQNPSVYELTQISQLTKK
jgi:Ribosomal protein L13